MLSRGAVRLPHASIVFRKPGILHTRSLWSPRSESDTNIRPSRPHWRGDDQPASGASNPPRRDWDGDDRPAPNAYNPPRRNWSGDDRSTSSDYNPPRRNWSGDDRSTSSDYNPPRRNWSGDDRSTSSDYNPPRRNWSGDDRSTSDAYSPPRRNWSGDDQSASSAYNPPKRNWSGDDQSTSNAPSPPKRDWGGSDHEVHTPWRLNDQFASRVRNHSYDDHRQGLAIYRQRNDRFATGTDYASNDHWKPNDLWKQHDQTAAETAETAETDVKTDAKTTETDTETDAKTDTGVRKKRRRKKSDEDPDTPIISRWKHDDLQSFISYAASINLDPNHTEYRERAYEYMTLIALFSKNMILKRPKSGYPEDMDLVGRWLLPEHPPLLQPAPTGAGPPPHQETGEQLVRSAPEPSSLSQSIPVDVDPSPQQETGEQQPIKSFRIFIQCEAVPEKTLDRLARRLQRNVRVSPARTVGFLACPLRLTNKARNLIRFQHRPMGYICISEAGNITDIFWNQTMKEYLVPGLGVGIQDVDPDPKNPEIRHKAVLTLNEVSIDGFFNGKEIPPEPEKVKKVKPEPEPASDSRPKLKLKKPFKKLYR